MKIKLDARILLGLLLILGGGLVLAQQMGYLENVSEYFWGGVFIFAGLVFLFSMFRGEIWASFPAFISLAIGTLILLPERLDSIGGSIFLGNIALAFWYIYFTNRAERWWAMIPAGVLTALLLLGITSFWFEDFSGLFVLGGIGITFFIVALTNLQDRWWALIPGGVISTLAVMTIAEGRFGEFKTIGFFFFGLAVTFLLVALLAKMKWAYWPALALGIMGVLGIVSLLEYANYLWAVMMIGVGVFILLQYFVRRA